MQLELRTLVDLSKLFTPTFSNLFKGLPEDTNLFIKENSENSTLYSLVYGESEAQIEDLEAVIDKKTKQVYELFGGNGLESNLLADKYPKITFSYFDIEKSVNSLRRRNNAFFLKRNVFHLALDEDFQESADLVFVGGANASLCCCYDLLQIEDTFRSAYACLKQGGTFMAAFFTEEGEENNYTFSHDEGRIKYHKKYRGRKYESFCMYPYIRKDSLHQYFHLLALYNKKGDEVETVYYNTCNFEYRSWPASILIEVASAVGFSPDCKFRGRYLEFKK